MGIDDLHPPAVSGPPGGGDLTDSVASTRVLHLDHTGAAGGAELALVRMLAVEPPWDPFVLTPPTGDGVFNRLDGTVSRGTGGIRQSAGVSSGGRGATIAAA